MASSRPPPVLPPGVAHSRRAALLTLAGLIAARSPLPYTAVAAFPLAWAAVELVLSMRDRRTSDSTTGTATKAPTLAQTQSQTRTVARSPARGIASSVAGLILVGLLGVTVLLPYAFYGPVKDLQDCTSGANTAIATRDCNARYDRDLDPGLRAFFRIGQRAGG